MQDDARAEQYLAQSVALTERQTRKVTALVRKQPHGELFYRMLGLDGAPITVKDNRKKGSKK